MKRGEPYTSLMYPTITADGELRYGECRGFGMRDERGRLVAIYGTFRDLNELIRLTENLKEAVERAERTRAD